jgi:serine/threonine protein phosphatase PrpC
MAQEEEKNIVPVSPTSGVYTPLAGVEVVAKTDIGKRREENQDNFVLIEKANFKLLVVADGMGGARGGAVASSMAVLTMKEQFKGVADISPQRLVHAIAVANSRIYDESIDKPKLAGMGTTIVCLAVTESSILVAHVGDSRAYRVRNGVMQKLTDDHTLVNELLRTGAITSDQAEHHPVSHMLTRSLGTGAEIDIDCRELKESPRKGDKFILMSDGLYNLVARQEIFKELSKDQKLDTCVGTLIDLANERGGTDNITIVAAVLDTPFPVPTESEKLEEIKDLADEIREPNRSAEPAPSVHFGISSNSNNWGITTKGIGSYRVPLIPVLIIFLAAFAWGVKLSLMREPKDNVSVIDITERGVNYAHHPSAKHQDDTQDALTQAQSPDPSRLRKALLEVMLKEVNIQKDLLTQSTKVNVERVAKQLAERKVKNISKREEIYSDKERATRKLTAWYSRKKRLETIDPINLAREISGISDSVKVKREAFEEVTWRYFKEAEALRYNPSDDTVKDRVSKILAQRRSAMETLGLEVRKVIENMIAEAEHELASLTEFEDLIAQDELAVRQQEQLLLLLKSDDANAIASKRQELESQIKNLTEQFSIAGQKNQEVDELSGPLFQDRSGQ